MESCCGSVRFVVVVVFVKVVERYGVQKCCLMIVGMLGCVAECRAVCVSLCRHRLRQVYGLFG